MANRADDWGDWASDCEQRRMPQPVRPTEVTVAFYGSGGRPLGTVRLDVATGAELPALPEPVAEVIELGRRGA